jgi:hypothetical protein
MLPYLHILWDLTHVALGGRRDLMDRAAAGRGGQIPMPMFFGPTKSMNVFSITHRGFF